MVRVVRAVINNCTCPTCKSTLEYLYQDIKEHKCDTDYQGVYNLVKGVQCPVCNTIVRTPKYGNS